MLDRGSDLVRGWRDAEEVDQVANDFLGAGHEFGEFGTLENTPDT